MGLNDLNKSKQTKTGDALSQKKVCIPVLEIDVDLLAVAIEYPLNFAENTLL